MRLNITIAFVLFSFCNLAQSDSTERTVRIRCKILYHELELDPVSVWCGKQFSFAQRLKYTYLLDDKNRISAEFNGVLFNALDANAEGGDWQGVFPKLNKTQLSYDWGWRYFRTRYRTRQLLRRIILRGGYHYFQHSTGRDNFEYWSIDSLQQTGLVTIAGFRSHSVLVGIGFGGRSHRVKDKKVRSLNHRFSIDYLFSPFYELKLYDSESTINPNSRWEKSELSFIRSGAQVGYHFLYEFNTTFGIHADLEALWVPFISNYQPNDNWFQPRGGERIYPLFINARTGFYWKF